MAWEVLERPKAKKALEFEVKVLPPTKAEVPIIAKFKIPAGVEVRAYAYTTEVKVLQSPRSRSCYCLRPGG